MRVYLESYILEKPNDSELCNIISKYLLLNDITIVTDKAKAEILIVTYENPQGYYVNHFINRIKSFVITCPNVKQIIVVGSLPHSLISVLKSSTSTIIIDQLNELDKFFDTKIDFYSYLSQFPVIVNNKLLIFISHNYTPKLSDFSVTRYSSYTYKGKNELLVQLKKYVDHGFYNFCLRIDERSFNIKIIKAIAYIINEISFYKRKRSSLSINALKKIVIKRPLLKKDIQISIDHLTPQQWVLLLSLIEEHAIHQISNIYIPFISNNIEDLIKFNFVYSTKELLISLKNALALNSNIYFHGLGIYGYYGDTIEKLNSKLEYTNNFHSVTFLYYSEYNISFIKDINKLGYNDLMEYIMHLYKKSEHYTAFSNGNNLPLPDIIKCQVSQRC
jgi:hypothetical protein